jgi:predicted RNA binding protein YcfA (HicA-like mRNA interferase family)
MSSISRKDFIRKLKIFGFNGPYSGGKHQFMIKDSLKLRIPNPHGAKDISISLLKEILRQANISFDEWAKIK